MGLGRRAGRERAICFPRDRLVATRGVSAIAGFAVIAGLVAIVVLSSDDGHDAVDVVTETAAEVAPRTEAGPDGGTVRICPDPQPLWHETVTLVTLDGVTLFSEPVGSDPVVFDGVPPGDLWLQFEYESEPAPPTDGVEIGTASRLERQPITVVAGQTTDYRC